MSTVKFKRSGVKDKKPLASQLELGQIAINFNDENPFISTLTNEGNVVEFPSKKGIQGLIDDALEEYQPGGTVDAYTKSETDQLLAGKSDSGHTHPQYLTEHQDISGKADKTELNNYLTTSAASSTYATKTDLNGKADSVHTHSYNDLEDKPVIPSTEGFATKQELGNYQPQSGMTSYLTIAQAEQDLQPKGDYLTQTSADERYAQIGDTPTDVYTKTETDQLLAGKSDSGHTHPQYLTEHQDISGKADKTDLANYQPLSAMTGYLTTSDAASTYQPKGDYLTEHQDISGKADKSELNDYLKTSAATETYATKDELAGKANSGHSHTSSDITDLSTILAGKSDTGHSHSYNDLTDKPVIPSTEGLATKQELGNYQPVSGMSGYSTTSHTHPQYVTSGDVEEMLSEYTPTGSNVWHGTYAEYIALAEKDNDTLYCITDVSQQYMTRGEADALYMPLSGMTNYQLVSAMTDYQTVANMSGYVTTSAATATYATKDELSGYARVISISQSDYDTLVSNNQVQQGVLYCIIEESN